MTVSSEPNDGVWGRRGEESFGKAQVGRCSWRNVRREKETKRQCLESRIDLMEDSLGILLQASLSAAQDRRTCPDCGPSVTSRLRKYGICPTASGWASILSGHGYAIELNADIAEDIVHTRYDRNRKRDTAIDLAQPSALIIAIDSDASSRKLLGDTEREKKPFSQADRTEKKKKTKS